MKKYDIKTTDKETLRKWFYLMTLGRAIEMAMDSKIRAISSGKIDGPRIASITQVNSPYPIF